MDTTSKKKEILRIVIKRGLESMRQDALPSSILPKEMIKKAFLKGTEKLKQDEKEKNIDEKINKLAEKIENLELQKGEQGKPGEKGERGEKGIRGEKGEMGYSGYTPIKGKDYFDGKNGKNAKDIDIEDVVSSVLSKISLPKSEKINTKDIAKEVIKLLKTPEYAFSTNDLKDIKAYTERMIGNKSSFSFNGKKIKFEELMHGGGSSKAGLTYSIDLSSQCNGSNKIFTIPKFSSIILLSGTDAPNIYKNGTDYNASVTTLTMTSQVNAPSMGATLVLTYTV